MFDVRLIPMTRIRVQVTWSTILQMARVTSTVPITSWDTQTTRPCRLRDNTPGIYFRGTGMIIELLRRRGENYFVVRRYQEFPIFCAPVPCRRRTSMRLCLSEDLVGACLEPRALDTSDCGTVVWCIRAWEGALLSWLRGREESRGGGGGGGPLSLRPWDTCAESRWSHDTCVACLSIRGVDTQSTMLPTLMLLCCEGDIAQFLALSLSRCLFHGVISRHLYLMMSGWDAF